METREAVPVVVIDNGSFQTRAGYAGEEGPRLVAPTLVGQARNKGVAMAAGMREYEVGNDAVQQRGMLSCTPPFHQGGLVNSWADAERLWSHVIYSELRLTPEDFCFVLTQSATAPAKEKELTLELMMETFNAHSLYLGAAPVFSLYSYGYTTGLVIDSGLDVTSAVPVHEGYALGRHVTSSPVAGKALTLYLAQLMKKRGYSFGTPVELDLMNRVKEDMCYVGASSVDLTVTGVAQQSLDETATLDALRDQHKEPDVIRLPDGQPVPIDEQRHECPEALFDFSILGKKYEPMYHMITEAGESFQPSIKKGISWLAFTAINHCEASLRNQLYDSIVLAGGTTSFAGTRVRILAEIRKCYRDTHANEGLVPITVNDMAARQYSAWLGGSMLSRTPMFPHLSVSRHEYAEHGRRIIHCKNL